jgi:murein DD-endopeptidase MepM/ murein hydrolase activator NlpD
VSGAARLGLAAVLLALTAAAAPPRSASDVDAWVRTQVEDYRGRFHYSAEALDADALAAKARLRTDETGSTAGLSEWLGGEITRVLWAFAPEGALHDPAARYALPFDPVFPRVLGQGPGGTYSHQGDEYHAFDFVMPLGTEVRAAREGIVARVTDGFTQGGADRALAPFANTVTVLHEDGTFASYAHLSPGIPVKEGERVSRGQALGRSGQTGWAGAPHLHFAVHRKERDGVPSVPIRFGRPGRPGFVPEQGTWVGFPPQPTIELTLYADGELVRTGAVLPTRSGESARIRVETRPLHGPVRDVTQHPRLQLVSMTPWNLEVVGPGEVAFRPMEDFPPDWDLDLDLAAVGVFFLNGAQGEIGLGKVEFRLTDRGPQAKR